MNVRTGRYLFPRVDRSSEPDFGSISRVLDERLSSTCLPAGLWNFESASTLGRFRRIRVNIDPHGSTSIILFTNIISNYVTIITDKSFVPSIGLSYEGRWAPKTLGGSSKVLAGPHRLPLDQFGHSAVQNSWYGAKSRLWRAVNPWKHFSGVGVRPFMY